MRLTASIAGLDELLAKLEGPAVPGAIEEAVMESTALLLNRTKKRFLEQVAPDGSVWEPSYAAFLRSFGLGKRKGKSGGGTLFDTGALFHSIQLHSVGPEEGAISSDVPYGHYHQLGIGQVKREFMGFSQEDEELALKVLFKKVSEALSS